MFDPARPTRRCQRAAWAETTADAHQDLLVGEVDGAVVCTAQLTWLRVLAADGGLYCQVEAAGVRLDVAVDPALGAGVLDDPVLGWATREAVTNVVRHAHAGRCRISLQTTGEQTVLIVKNNGRGIGAVRGSTPRDHELTGLRERVSEAGGLLEVRAPATGRGAEVVVLFPTPFERRRGSAHAPPPVQPAPQPAPPTPRDTPQDARR